MTYDEGIIARLRTMYSHRGDGIATQYVNPDGPEAADLLTECARVLDALVDGFDDSPEAERARNLLNKIRS